MTEKTKNFDKALNAYQKAEDLMVKAIEKECRSILKTTKTRQNTMIMFEDPIIAEGREFNGLGFDEVNNVVIGMDEVDEMSVAYASVEVLFRICHILKNQAYYLIS